jgi:ComF family protein
MNFFYKLYKYLVDYLFPYRCLKCFSYTQDENGLCSSCFAGLHFNAKPFCIICGKGFNIDIDQSNLCGPCTVKKPIYDQARFIIRYDEKSKGLIHSFKYNDKTILSKIFCKMLYTQYREFIESSDIIVPIPMHKLKRLSRLYNQTQYLAKSLSDLSKINMISDLLIKYKYTKPQTSLNQKARKKNINNSFLVNKKYDIKGKTILIIDDVITTGSTISECAKILKKEGCRKVFVIAIAATNNMYN